MSDWIIPALCGLVVAFVLVKAFWRPPSRDDSKSHDHMPLGDP